MSDPALTNAFLQMNKILQFQNGLLTKGLIYDKQVSKFGKTSAAIYLPKRFIGRSFRVILIPIEETDLYSLAGFDEDKSVARGKVKEKDIAKEAEKDLEAIQSETKRKKLIE